MHGKLMHKKFIEYGIILLVLYFLLKSSQTGVVSSKIIPGPLMTNSGGVLGLYVGGN